MKSDCHKFPALHKKLHKDADIIEEYAFRNSVHMEHYIRDIKRYHSLWTTRLVVHLLVCLIVYVEVLPFFLTQFFPLLFLNAHSSESISQPGRFCSLTLSLPKFGLSDGVKLTHLFSPSQFCEGGSCRVHWRNDVHEKNCHNDCPTYSGFKNHRKKPMSMQDMSWSHPYKV